MGKRVFKYSSILKGTPFQFFECAFSCFENKILISIVFDVKGLRRERSGRQQRGVRKWDAFKINVE